MLIRTPFIYNHFLGFGILAFFLGIWGGIGNYSSAIISLGDTGAGGGSGGSEGGQPVEVWETFLEDDFNWSYP
jgi:hypothetical protein